ncbi:MAG: insulinase family protein [Dehalococcoidia bacterium]|nr:insulinase family protein [Dehalococcoidia bacterium]
MATFEYHPSPLASPAISSLENGLRLVVTPMPFARSVALSVYVAAGSRYEATPEEAGLSHFLEHLCFKGTERRPRPLTISMEIDAMGGNLNAATNRELTVYYGKMTPEYLPQAIDLLADLLRNSTLADEEIERERGVILEELAAVEDSPSEQVGVVLDQMLWPGQPHGRDIAGTEESVQGMPDERIREYYHGQYVPNGVVVSIAGAIHVLEAEALVREHFGDWRRGSPSSWVPHREEPRGPRLVAVEKDLEQVHLSVGMRAVSSVDEDRYALDLLSVILGEGMSSRLFTRLREDLGLCYDIHSYMATLLDTGMFGVYAGIDPDDTVEAVQEITRELLRARRPVAPDELERAKAVTRSRTQLRMEDTRAVSALYGSQLILGLPTRTPEETLARSAAVTVEEVEHVAGRVFVPERLQFASVGPVPSSTLEGALDLAAGLDCDADRL